MSLMDELAALDTSETQHLPEPGEAFQAFPLDCFPATLTGYASKAAESIGCDVSFVALPMLSAIAAAIGGSRRVEVKPGFLQPAILWTGIVADSGSGKSPAFSSALQSLYEIEMNWQDEYAEDCERIRCAAEELGSKGKKERVALAYPPLPRLCISDTTMEGLAPLLKENSDGLLLAADELSGWLASINQYKGGRGSDRSHWLSLYDGTRLTIDRKTGPIRVLIIPRAIVSITGGIQPGVLKRSLSLEDFESGLPARFVLAMPPDEPIGWSETPMPSAEPYVDVLDTLLAERGSRRIIPLEPEARELMAEMKNQDIDRLKGLPGALRAAWSKSCGRAARLALLLQSAEDPDRETIDVTVMERAVRLSRWFDRETARIYQALEVIVTPEAELLSLLAEMREATPRDLQNWKRSRFPTAGDAERELNRLVQEGRMVREEQASTGGRPRTVFRWIDE